MMKPMMRRGRDADHDEAGHRVPLELAAAERDPDEQQRDADREQRDAEVVDLHRRASAWAAGAGCAG